jgi:hypothetical protein
VVMRGGDEATQEGTRRGIAARGARWRASGWSSSGRCTSGRSSSRKGHRGACVEESTLG